MLVLAKKDAFLFTKEDNFNVIWNSQKDLCINNKSGLNTDELKRFHVLAYADKLHTKLLHNWQIEILPIEPLYVKVSLGVPTPVELMVKGKKHVSISKMFSNRPEIVTFQHRLISLNPFENTPSVLLIK